MKITKRQLRRIIKEERQKLTTESVSDMRQLDDEVSSAAFGVATTFSELMYKLKDEMPAGDISPTWDGEVESAEDALMDKIIADINAAIKMIEAQLHDGAFYRG